LIVNPEKPFSNLLGDWARTQKYIRMSRAAFQQDAKPFEIVAGGQRIKNLNITAVASSAVEVKDPGGFDACPSNEF
jgi:hypothetical protein